MAGDTSCAPASFIYTIASLPSVTSEKLTVLTTINAVGVFDNVYSVGADQPDGNQSNNIDDTGNGGDEIIMNNGSFAFITLLDDE